MTTLPQTEKKARGHSPPLLHQNRLARNVLLTAIYLTLAVMSLWLAYWLRFDFVAQSNPQREEFFRLLLSVLGVKFCALLLWGHYQSLLTFFSTPDLKRVGGVTFTVLLGNWALWSLTLGASAPPRGVIVLDALLFGLLLCGFRYLMRAWRERFSVASNRKMEPVAIVGAGEAGAYLAQQLLTQPRYGLEPLVFLDDDRSKWGSRIHGIPVRGDVNWLTGPRAPKHLKRIIIALPTSARRRIRAIVKKLEGRGFTLDTVPSLKGLLAGEYTPAQVRPLQIEDLLGREPVAIDCTGIKQMLKDQVVAVTGAGGSIGSELCRQIVAFEPRQLLLIEQCETLLFSIEQELIGAGQAARIRPIVADICDEPRITKVLSRFRPRVIFHAAAHKHVPLMEMQPGEALRNNALGTSRLARLAAQFEVQRFILISTDKAINPTSIMGASKRLAEMYVQALQQHNHTDTRFMAVRFGNVLGSSGSVVPIFQRQIAEGGPVRVTHPHISRYFMTIPEAVGLVLQSAALGQGGEIFLLEMGKPIKIVDLARQMIRLQGLRPEEDIPIEFVGLRPGEKLCEELNYSAEVVAPTHHSKIFRLLSPPTSWEKISERFQELQAWIEHYSPEQIKSQLGQLLPEYQPNLAEDSSRGTAAVIPGNHQERAVHRSSPRMETRVNKPPLGSTPARPVARKSESMGCADGAAEALAVPPDSGAEGLADGSLLRPDA
jgi:FlaA1/EpsC-like NDP-sugar epimerase